MRKLPTLILFLVLSASLFANYGGSSVYMHGSIITKTETIKCYIELSDSYNGRVKYKMNKEDKKEL